VNPPGALLDTGPLVALLSKNDADHDRAVQMFADHAPPLRCCEAVLAEACFLMKKVHASAPAEVITLGRKNVFEIALQIEDHWKEIETLLKKYSSRPISLADAALIRCAEVYQEPRILTFDSDFQIYRWSRKKKFVLV